MFIAMCNYLGWNIDEIGKPFESEEAWSLDTEDSENFEVDGDTASADEDSPTMGSIMNEPMEEAMETECDDTEEVVDEAGENSGISVESE